MLYGRPCNKTDKIGVPNGKYTQPPPHMAHLNSGYAVQTLPPPQKKKSGFVYTILYIVYLA